MDTHHLGRLTVHHLIPRFRLRVYYGVTFKMPGNKLKLRELRHAAWHVLFGSQSLNEIINYLYTTKEPFGYKTVTWNIVFKNKTPWQAARLLIRVRRIIRKQYQYFEFDPSLKRKLHRMYKKEHRTAAQLYLQARFKVAA